MKNIIFKVKSGSKLLDLVIERVKELGWIATPNDSSKSEYRIIKLYFNESRYNPQNIGTFVNWSERGVNSDSCSLGSLDTLFYTEEYAAPIQPIKIGCQSFVFDKDSGEWLSDSYVYDKSSLDKIYNAWQKLALYLGTNKDFKLDFGDGAALTLEDVKRALEAF